MGLRIIYRFVSLVLNTKRDGEELKSASNRFFVCFLYFVDLILRIITNIIASPIDAPLSEKQYDKSCDSSRVVLIILCDIE